jgi:cytochrome P450
MRQSIADLRPRIERLVGEQLEHVAARSRTTDGQVDLIAELARPLPLSVICEVLGLPQEDRPKFKKWFSSFANIKSFWGIGRVVPGIRKTMKYLQGQFELVKREPRPGLIGALVEAEQSGDRLSDDELLSMAMLLLLAGHETTVHLMSNCILIMLQLEDVRESLQQDWRGLDPAFEEMMRYASPAQFGKPRWSTRDVEFHGYKLKRGDAVMPLLASANYDPERFENPAQFQIDRPRNYHLGFGAGPHVCLGLKLARTETQVVLQQLFTRWPDLASSFPIHSPDWSRRLGMRALKTLNVRCPK